MMQILGLLDMYFDVVVVFVKKNWVPKNSLLIKLAMTIVL
jgi:hypothetical protein